MSNPTESTRTLVIERVFAHPLEKLWRALTESSLIEQWMMKNDFQPVVGHRFTLHLDPMPNWDGIAGLAKWNGVIHCRVLAVEPCRTLSYTWAALGLESVVKFTLTPTDAGTHLHMEQSGFRLDQEVNYNGTKFKWQGFIGALEGLVSQTSSIPH